MSAKVVLPVVDQDADLLDALEVMQRAGKRAVVVRGAIGNVVVPVEDLLGVIRKSNERGQPAYKTFGDFDWRGSVTRTHGSQALDGGDTGYRGAAASKPEFQIDAIFDVSAEVITDHEWRGGQVDRSLTLCRCRVDRHHIFEPTELAVPNECNYGDGPVDCG